MRPFAPTTTPEQKNRLALLALIEGVQPGRGTRPPGRRLVSQSTRSGADRFYVRVGSGQAGSGQDILSTGSTAAYSEQTGRWARRSDSPVSGRVRLSSNGAPYSSSSLPQHCDIPSSLRGQGLRTSPRIFFTMIYPFEADDGVTVLTINEEDPRESDRPAWERPQARSRNRQHASRESPIRASGLGRGIISTPSSTSTMKVMSRAALPQQPDAA